MVSAASYVATANGATASCIMTAANVKVAAIVATATATSTTSDNRVLTSNPTSASSAPLLPATLLLPSRKCHEPLPQAAAHVGDLPRA